MTSWRFGANVGIITKVPCGVHCLSSSWDHICPSLINIILKIKDSPMLDHASFDGRITEAYVRCSEEIAGLVFTGLDFVLPLGFPEFLEQSLTLAVHAELVAIKHARYAIPLQMESHMAPPLAA